MASNASGQDYQVPDDITNITERTETNEYDGLYKIPPLLVAFLCFCYIMVSLVAVIGNSMVLFIVVKSKRMRSVTNYFICNLSAADIMIGEVDSHFKF